MHEGVADLLEDMKARVISIRDSLNYDQKKARLAELEEQMGQTDFWNDPDKANEVVGELKTTKAQIEPVKNFSQKLEDAEVLWEMAEEADDQDTRLEVDQQIDALERELDRLETVALLSGKYDARNCYLTIQSGAGGTEADDWAEMLLRMYLYYCEKMGWKVSEVSKTHGTEAGVSEVTLHIEGPFAFGHLSTERGTHRLARVSPFNAEGKRQTSFATVEAVPEFPETGSVEIQEEHLDVTAFARSSGPGGQNVNKVASAVRLVYQTPEMGEPIMVVCSVERKQEQNRRQAMNILRGKLEYLEEQKREAEMAAATGGSVDRGWGSQIRSYVLYDNRVKDHRTSHEVGNPQRVLDGEIEGFIEAELRRRARQRTDAEKA
ncbi:MAG: peptide chain release factor 2 [Phycisphaeraceae bacterium]